MISMLCSIAVSTSMTLSSAGTDTWMKPVRESGVHTQAVVTQAKTPDSSAGPSVGTETLPKQIPVKLYMPPNPPAPGREAAAHRKLSYLLAQRSTNYNHASPSQAKNIELVAKRLNGTVIQPGQTFSYNGKLGPYTEQNGYGWGRAFSGNRIVPSLGGGVCQGASTLYSTLIRTDAVTFVERHAHSLTVPYLPAGEDATVSYSSHLDFRFKNTSQSPIMIGAAGYPDKRIITIAIWGAKPAPEITVHHKVLAVYSFQTIQKSSPSSETKVVAPGQVGGKVATWLEIKTSNGVVTKSLGTDTYKPSPRIIEK